jgi:nucleotide-binding universal stress UspA family protein
MLERIMVAVDGSPAAASALAVVRVLAAAGPSQVVVVHVTDHGRLLRSVHGPDTMTLQWETPAAARDLVDRAAAELVAVGIQARGQVYGRFDTTARELLDAARMTGSQLLVMGTRGRGRITASLLGSVAHRVIHLAELPLLTTPELPAGTEPSLERLLVAVDGSPVSRRAVDAAAELALRVGAEVLVVHITQADGASWEAFHDDQLSVEVDRPQTSFDLVGQIADELRKGGVSASVKVRAFSGNIAHDILGVAARRECGLIVIGSRGRSALPSLVLGSTTYQLLHLATRPVLVVR